LFEKAGILVKEGNRLKYITQEGTEIKQFRKPWEANEEGCLDTVMAEYSDVKEALDKLNNEDALKLEEEDAL
jgi:hypothetical protein